MNWNRILAITIPSAIVLSIIYILFLHGDRDPRPATIVRVVMPQPWQDNDYEGYTVVEIGGFRTFFTNGRKDFSPHLKEYGDVGDSFMMEPGDIGWLWWPFPFFKELYTCPFCNNPGDPQ